MDFDFSEDQMMLRNLVREFLTEQTPVSHVRAMMDDERGYDPDVYRNLVQLGILPFPEEYGGGGLGMVEQAIILEEMARIPYPGPYFSSVILAASALMHSGDDNAKARYLPDIANGDLTATVAFLDDAIGWDANAISLRITKDGSQYRLNGVKPFVPFGQTADVVFVVGRLAGARSDALSLVAVPKNVDGLEVQLTPMLDLTSKVATLQFNDVSVPVENLVGDEGAAWPGIAAMLQRAAVGASAEMLGAARKSLEMSTDYAKVRKQFGQYIGQFQAVKHMLAEMLEQVENAHAAVYYAAWALDAGSPDAALAASVAKSTVNEAARKVCGDAIQAHGGIGYTWEYDLHLYFKRAKHFEPLFGDTAFHRERVLEEVLAGRSGMAGAELPAD